jgi:hypothetical protein
MSGRVCPSVGGKITAESNPYKSPMVQKILETAPGPPDASVVGSRADDTTFQADAK